MPKRLHEPRIRTKPLRIFEYPGYQDFVGLLRLPELQRELLALRTAIRNGAPVPDKFYRADVDTDEPPDTLLADAGIMHLHLGGSKSDVLVFLVQYDDGVMFIEINNHKHFRTDPPGEYLRQLHDAMLKRREVELGVQFERERLGKTAEAEAKRSAIRDSLFGKKKP